MTENFANLVLEHLTAIQNELMTARERNEELLAKMAKLEAGLDQITLWLEDYEDLKLAEQEMIELQAGRSRTYTLDEVERDLGFNPQADKI